MKSKYQLRTIKNGKPFLGEVNLAIKLLPDAKEHKIIEAYTGVGFRSQGYIESIPKEGYDSWRKGIRNGVDYGLSKIIDKRKFEVTILDAQGLTTDTNPIILAFVASRAILRKIENKEAKTDFDKIEVIVYSSWEYELESQIDFTNFTVESYGKYNSTFNINNQTLPPPFCLK